MHRIAARCLVTLLLLVVSWPIIALERPVHRYALELDGAGHVGIPHDAAFNMPNQFTIEAWVRRDNDSRCETVVSRGYQTSWWLGFCNQAIRFYGAGGGTAKDGNTAVPANVWTHVAVVYRSGAGRIYYINGEMDLFDSSPDPVPTETTSPVHIGADPAGGFNFQGKIASVRIWSYARSQKQIRRNLHTDFDTPRPGLVANWRLNLDFLDNAGGHDGGGSGTAGFALEADRPGQPPVIPIDETFNSLPFSLEDAASVYLPEANQVLLIGGNRGGTLSEDVTAVDAATGVTTPEIATLPVGLRAADAVRVPGSGLVYVFGGVSASAYRDEIIEINPATGGVRTLDVRLPQPLAHLAAAWHGPSARILLFGGDGNTAGRSDQVLIFDPATESLTVAATPLPTTMFALNAVTSSLDDRIYLFGGYIQSSSFAGQSDQIIAVTVAEDGSDIQLEILPTTLHRPMFLPGASEDPHTGLIYLAAAGSDFWISVFDPSAGRVWRTRMALPRERHRASVAYSPLNRHLLIIGGDQITTLRNVWRVPVADGPPVPAGDWDFPSGAPSMITSIAGEGRGVAFGSDANGAYRYRDSIASRSVYSPFNLGSASGKVNEVAYQSANDYVWIATDDAGAALRGTTTTASYDSGLLGTSRVLSIARNPAASGLNGQPWFGTAGRGSLSQRYQFSVSGGTYVWRRNFDGENIQAISHRPGEDFWLLANGRLKQVIPGSLSDVQDDFGLPCGRNGARDLVVAPNGDWWVVTDASEFGAAMCRIPAAATPGSGFSFCTALGCRGRRLDVDAEGRIWAGLESDAAHSGGMAAYEVTGGSTNVVRTTELNWLNAPLARLASISVSASERLWDSGVSAVGAADEKVWVGNRDGRLATLTQRWRRMEEGGDLRLYDTDRVWLERGHAFVAGPNNLHVLLPDGRTWREHFGLKVNDVEADARGRIWLATDAGLRLYRPDGSIADLSDREGTPPAAPVRALAVDRAGRVWIGGDGGLTLFDRERFVMSWNMANSGMPSNSVRAMLVDSDNRVWAGTDAGLVRLDDNRLRVFTSADGLPGDIIDDLAQLGSGEIAISLPGTTVALFDGGTVTTLPTPPTPQPVPLSTDEKGRLWAGRALLTNGAWRSFYPTNSGMIQVALTDVAADRAGRVWFAHGTFGGVAVRSAHLPALASTLPLVSGVSPLRGGAGQTVTITGTGFGTNRSDVEVMIGMSDAEVLSVSSTEIRARLNEMNTSGEVVIRVGGRQVTASSTFCAVPSIHRFTPTGVNAGGEVVVHGANFDRGARLRIGDGVERTVSTSPVAVRTVIRGEDGDGLLRVRNTDYGCDETATSSLEFRRLEVTIDRLVLNQGYPSAGLVTNRPTLVQNYLRSDRILRGGSDHDDRLEIDRVELRFAAPGMTPQTINQVYDGPEPMWPSLSGTYPPALLRDITNSLNVTAHPSSAFVPGSLDRADTVAVRSRLYNGSQLVAETTRDVHFRPDQTVNVLLVPILRNDWTPAVLDEIRNRVNPALEDARNRLFPFGRIRFLWSPTVYRADDMIPGFNEQLDIADVYELYMASHNLDRARRSWNSSRGPEITVAFGVVDATINSGGAAGKAFWPDISAMINALGASALDDLCEFGDAVINFFSLGLAGGDGCDIEIPLYVAWAEDTGNASHLFGHELGHVLGLVRATSANGDTGDFSHSVFDEIGGGTCTDVIDGAGFFETDNTLYRSPGMQMPVVNPLTGEQFLPRLSEETTWDVDGTPVTSAAFTARAKATMSYACSRGNRSTFFEPADVVYMGLPLTLDAMGRSTTAGPTPRGLAGRRIYVSGEVDRLAGTGELVSVQALGTNGPLDASYSTGYELVQLDTTGAVLARRGIFPVFASSEDGGGVGRTQLIDQGFFAATVLAEPGVARLELRHHDAVLDSHSAGGGAPTATLSSPTGGSYGSGAIPVNWTASDPDGDALSITISYSADDGATWTPVAFASGSGSAEVPVAVLAGSTQARIRVQASDGFSTGGAVSAPFTVAGRPPSAWIGSPDDAGEYLEWQPVPLSGGASDNADLEVAAAGLTWTSSRDGIVGTGAAIAPQLSVGTHVITLEAVNSAGLSDTASISVVVRGDYDADGVPDDEELALGLNPLRAIDAYADSDGDGLPDRMERAWGTDPFDPDTSGSGSTDAEDIAVGLDPLDPTDSLPPDALQVTPVDVAMFADLAAGTLLPRAGLQVLSRAPVAWSVSADQSWLVPYPVSGTTPDIVSLRAQADTLADGSYTGSLTFSSVLGEATVAVVLEVNNSADDPLRFIFTDRFEAPPD